MARALGFRFDYEHPPSSGFGAASEQQKEKDRGCVTDLVNLSRIEKPQELKLPKIIAAVDVQNPLLGENGATRVFGQQKSRSEDELNLLEQALTRLADLVAKDFGSDYRDRPGAGAAGGLGFGLMSFCGATIGPGFDVVAEAVGLESKMKGVDIVITGVGRCDR